MKYTCRKYKYAINKDTEELLDLVIEFGLFRIWDSKSNNSRNGVSVYLDDHEERPSTTKTSLGKLYEEYDRLKTQLEQSKQSYEEKSKSLGIQSTSIDLPPESDTNISSQEGELKDVDVIRIEGLLSRMKKIQELLGKYSSLESDGEIDLKTSYSLLGYYNRDGQNGPEVILLMDSLGNLPTDKWLIVTTFIHEMMHAIFDKSPNTTKKYIPLVEEPLTEYATLDFCMRFVNKYPQFNKLYEYAKRNILSKQFVSGISYYGFGYYLHSYEQYYNIIPKEITDGYRYCDWKTMFSDVIYRIHEVAMISTYESFFEGWSYPFGKEGECMKALFKILAEAKQLNRRFKCKVTPPCYLKDVGNFVFTDNGYSMIFCREKLLNIEVPQGVRTIGESLFEGQTKLCHVILPKSLRFIKDKSFYKCSNLESVIIPEGVRVIRRLAFCKCRKLKCITLPNTLIGIHGSALYGCQSLETLILPDSIYSISSAAFAFCKSLKTAKLPMHLRMLGSFAFKNCTSLESIKIPGTAYIIRESTFEGCTSMKNIEIDDGIVSVEKMAFRGCANLESVKIPRSVEYISNFAFLGCDHLKEIIFSGTKEEWNRLIVDLPIVAIDHTVKCVDGDITVSVD